MYINREPLGKGNLTFGRRRRPLPIFQIMIYVGLMGVAMYFYFQAEVFRPQVAAMIGPTPTPTMSIDQTLQLAEEAYMDGDLEMAVTYYDMSVALYPQDTELLVDYARVLMLNESYDAALEIADQAILSADENDARGYAVKARILNWMGQEDAALIEALRAQEADPSYPLAYAYLAEVYNNLERWREAYQNAERAVTMDPYNVDARWVLALVLEFQGDYRGAVQQYQQALALEPNLLPLLYGLARNYRGALMYEQSIMTYEQIKLRSPEDPRPNIVLGLTYFEMREDASAQANFQEALNKIEQRDLAIAEGADLEPFPDWMRLMAWQQIGQVYFTRRNYESAVETLQLAIDWTEANPREDDESLPAGASNSASIEVYYVKALAHYYMDQCSNIELSREYPLHDGPQDLLNTAMTMYLDRPANDPSGNGYPIEIRDQILRAIILCNDYAFTPPERPIPIPEQFQDLEFDLILDLPGQAPNETEDDNNQTEEAPQQEG
ncbi:MAG: hypothetical protein GYB68_17375 [Chloroflexi bacterium]|nr:hypothetical protein [Chloroflexota bacterium]